MTRSTPETPALPDGRPGDASVPIWDNSTARSQSRRERLITRPNARAKIDYIVGLHGFTIAMAGRDAIEVVLRYVPDRMVIEEAAWAHYLGELSAPDGARIEELATTILDDVANEVVPRWLGVSLERQSGAGPCLSVMVEDRQPQWDNPALLARGARC